MRTVLLIGTNHVYQRPDIRGSEEFRTLIEDSREEHDIKIIAEEMSLDVLHKYGATESSCKQVADSIGIPHLYCDPSYKEQKKLGIKQPGRERDPVADAIREDYWLEHILKQNSWPVLFICGADHTESFRDLLQANDIVVCMCCSKDGDFQKTGCCDVSGRDQRTRARP